MFLSALEAKDIANRILSRSRASSCTVSIDGGNGANVRFAAGNATTNGAMSGLTVTIRSDFGQRSGVTSVTAIDDAELVAAQTKSEAIARVAPANPEFMPPLGPQAYLAEGAGYDPASANVQADALAAAAGLSISQAKGHDVDITGYIDADAQFQAFATSAGLFAYDKRTETDFTLTARSRVQNWSGWAGTTQTSLQACDPARLGERAVAKGSQNAAPADLDPGKYTVILEPAAAADLVGLMLEEMSAREADEGRNFLSRAGGSKLGEKLFPDSVTISSDPADPMAPETIYGAEGVPQQRTLWIEGGVIKNLVTSRFWAQKTGRQPLAAPSSFAMAGGTVSIGDMIAATKKGILVTRLWYIRTVDPRTLLLTGMTRDGNFLIEGGRITGPARNLRFNESPVSMLANIDAIGPSERTVGSEVESGAMFVPPLLVKDFTFSSRSSGI